MIVLDTNVVSEAMKPEAHASVRAWLNEQAAETLYFSTVTLAELLFGVAALPAGKRKELLAAALDGLLDLFRDRILVFDIDAARRRAPLAVTAKTSGRGFPTADGYNAAIAASRRIPGRSATPRPACRRWTARRGNYPRSDVPRMAIRARA